MATTHPEAVRNAHVDTIFTALAGGNIVILDASNNPLCTFALPNPLAPAATGGVGTANTISPVNASATGTAAKFVAETSANVPKILGDVGIAGSGAACTVATTAFVLNQTQTITSFTYTAFP